MSEKTGVNIICSTGYYFEEEGTKGPEQAKLLISEGADPAKIQIGHMGDNLDMGYQLETLEQGVYISWDRMGLQRLVGCPLNDQRYPVIADLIQKGFSDKLMLSHDQIQTIIQKNPEKLFTAQAM